ncbi:hypothetical protein [Streptomyces griseofuscus]|uniref:hypothetical protein n=1 Tax=Streptomyces griseofuscus TaxID=146922 RepID=UPI0017C1A4C8|nr:hypothetical protein [Streptomyces murinus]
MTQSEHRINGMVEVWYEISADGRKWRTASVYGRERAVERVETASELDKILASYSRVLEASAAVLTSDRPAFVRTVIQGQKTRRVLGVCPRRWNADARRYEPTGGEWCVTDTPDACLAWQMDWATSNSAGLLAA